MMKNSTKKSDNKKVVIIFVAVMVILYAAGYFIGQTIAKVDDAQAFADMQELVTQELINIIPMFYIVVSLLAIIVPTILYVSCSQMYRKLQQDQTNDELWDELEEKLNGPVMASNIFAIIGIFFFCCFIYIALMTDYGKNGGFQMVVVIADFVLYLIASVVEVLIPHLTVKIEKELNPEKEGNVLDFHFNEIWLNSSDEAQKLIAYKAAYQAFKNTNHTCIVLCVISMICMFLFKTGIYALGCICIVWLVNVVSYMVRGAKLERGNR